MLENSERARGSGLRRISYSVLSSVCRYASVELGFSRTNMLDVKAPNIIIANGLDTVTALKSADEESLMEIDGIGPKTAKLIVEAAKYVNDYGGEEPPAGWYPTVDYARNRAKYVIPVGERLECFELEPCPFCGQKAKPEALTDNDGWIGIMKSREYDEWRIKLYRVCCTSCDAARVAQKPERAVAKWNTRFLEGELGI